MFKVNNKNTRTTPLSRYMLAGILCVGMKFKFLLKSWNVCLVNVLLLKLMTFSIWSNWCLVVSSTVLQSFFSVFMACFIKLITLMILLLASVYDGDRLEIFWLLLFIVRLIGFVICLETIGPFWMNLVLSCLFLLAAWFVSWILPPRFGS